MDRKAEEDLSESGFLLLTQTSGTFRVLDQGRQVVFFKTTGCSLEELEEVRWVAGGAGGAGGGVL